MKTEELSYDLPEESIAQTPVEPRDSARLLVDRGPLAPPSDATVLDLPAYLCRGDLLILNETRVLPARVAVARPNGTVGEVLFLEPADRSGGGWWEALCRPSRKLPPGTVVESLKGSLAIEIGAVVDDGRRLVRPLLEGPLVDALTTAGVAPLPPYITSRLEDEERYQTVFSRRAASAAAPTAGLHMTERVLAAMGEAGVEVAKLELVVGLDTFRPVTTETVEEHQIHSEWYQVPEATWEAVERTRVSGGRVVAVGTTSMRALESVHSTGRMDGRTRLFITPGFQFGAVDLLMTNFHLPRSSLLAMVEAFTGSRWRDLYRVAIERGYRLLSFGDAMLLEKAPPSGDLDRP